MHSSTGPSVGMGMNDPTGPTRSNRASLMRRALESSSSDGTTRSSPT